MMFFFQMCVRKCFWLAYPLSTNELHAKRRPHSNSNVDVIGANGETYRGRFFASFFHDHPWALKICRIRFAHMS